MTTRRGAPEPNDRATPDGPAAGAVGAPLPRPFFARRAEVVAPELLGVLVVAGGVVARLTEVEAYEPDDPASHSYIGERPRTRAMFGPPGHLYVYRSYGVHWCANVVCDAAGVGAAVLLRAAEVCQGAAVALARRPGAAGAAHLLCAGPGRLCTALAVSGDHDGVDLTSPAGPFHLAMPYGMEWSPGAIGPPPWCPPAERVARTTRIGITKAAELPRRWLELGNRSVSRPPARR